MEEMMPAAPLAAAKRKLEDELCVKISTKGLDAVVYSLEHFNPQLDSETAIRDKAVEILEESCKLVLERFRNCAYELEVNETECQLRQALIDVVELYRDNHPDSQSWLKRVRIERDSASIHISVDFLEQWSSVLEASPLSWLGREYDVKLREWETCALYLSKGVRPHVPGGGIRKLVRILSDVRGELIEAFGSLLTVGDSHVAEVVSALTDIPPTEVFFYTDPNRKGTAVDKTNRRVLHQGRIVGSIFSILDLHRCIHHGSETVRRPRGLFLLLGGSGCGKTEIAKAVAEHWYCDASRLVEIDMSECAEVGRVSEVVRKRPYSVIVLDKIDKAASCVESFIREVVLSGNVVDFSKSIIFMTSDVGASPPVFTCGCYNESFELEEKLFEDPDILTFFKTHKCYYKGYRRERDAINEARKLFGDELLDCFDSVYVMEFGEEHKKAVSRLLLREIVGGSRFLVHISDAALNVLLRSLSSSAIKEALLADMRPLLSAERGHNNSDVVYVDALIGSNELLFRFEAHEKNFLVDRYLKQKDKTLGDAMANLRIKVQMAYMFFELRKIFMSKENQKQANDVFLEICNLLLRFSPFASEEPATRKVLLDNLPMVEEQEEEKENIKDVWMRLLEIDTGLAKATRIIIGAVAKIIDDPLQSHDDPPARYYLFLCLDDDAKKGLNKLLTESLRSSDSGNSFFTFVDLNNDNCRGEEVKEMMIDKVKERANAVFMLDGVEYADLVLYRSLLKIFDEGALEDDQGLTIDFRRAIVILTSEAANKRTIAHIFNYKEHVLRTMATNQDVKRFRTELVHRVDEIVLFDPILPEHGAILRLPKRDICFKSRSASTLLSTFLSKLFCPHDDPKDIYDMFKAMDIDEVMGTRKNFCC
ncbi:chaperone protein clpb1 [Phtheirospermum japonicum]|uniref:Chaperone protein clpb1 n=1 Tax=Phtheirospermum japonicum TaxID=374723 RepID=A0A830B9I8_9LAMI|nr:chaperone protein clpb1 [Phtheirospermum japonicum]